MFLFGCEDEPASTPFVSPIAEHIDVQFILEGASDAFAAKSNILAVEVGLNADFDYWFVEFTFDDEGAAAIALATSSENKYKAINIVVIPESGDKFTAAAPYINNQITDGVVPVSLQNEQDARNLHSVVTTGYDLSYWEYFNTWGEYPY